VYADDISRVVVIYGQASTDDYYANILEVTGSAYTASSKLTIYEGTGSTLSSNGTDFDIIYDPDTDRIFFVYRSSGGAKARVLTASTSAVTVGAEQNVDNETYTTGFMSTYDTNLNRVILSYTTGEASGGNYARVIAITGGGTNTISVGSQSSQIQALNANGKGGIAFNSKDNKSYVVLGVSGSKLKRYELTCSTTAVTSIGSAVEISSAITPAYANIVYNTDEEALVTIFQENASTSKDLKYQVLYYLSSTSSNLDTANYLGVASTSASANASVNINIPGSINNDQTGLTIGKNYYTSGAGVISTTLSSNFVGKAISSTQLLLEEKKGNSLDGFSNGAITKGKPVVMQADGDVAQVVSTSNSESFSQQQGTEIQLSNGETSQFTSANNNNGTFLVVYKFQSTGRMHARLGTYASNGNITWGTDLTLTKPVGQQQATACYYDSDNDCFVVIGGTGLNEKIYATILTYSGVALTEGNFVEFVGQDSNTNGVSDMSASYDTTNKIGYVVVGQYGNSITKLTVSGTSITASAFQYIFGSYGSTMQYVSLDYDIPNNRGVIYFRDSSNNYYATVIAFTSASGTLTFGTKVVLTSVSYAGKGTPAHSPTQSYVAYLHNDTSVIYYNNLTFSGTTITAGTRQTLYTTSNIHHNGSTQNFVYNPDGKFYFVWSRNGSPYELGLLEAVVSGTTLNATLKVNQSNSSAYEHWIVGNTSKSNPTMILVGYDSGNTDGDALTFRPAATITVTTENLTATNYIGIASNTVANNENATIQTQGAVNPDQSSLTAGQLYYVQTDGTLSTTAGSLSVVAGIATSATTLLITRS
jgi:hypothetical protein